jgi:hypothetical protein
MARLMEKGLVRSLKQGKFVNYYVEGNAKDIPSILKRYYPSIWNRLSNRLADLFLDISSALSLQDSEIKEVTEPRTTNKENDGDVDDEQSNEEFNWWKNDENYRH